MEGDKEERRKTFWTGKNEESKVYRKKVEVEEFRIVGTSG